MKPQYINSWEAWKELCLYWEIDPHKNLEFSEGLSGGNTRDYEYIGDVPEKEE